MYPAPADKKESAAAKLKIWKAPWDFGSVNFDIEEKQAEMVEALRLIKKDAKWEPKHKPTPFKKTSKCAQKDAYDADFDLKFKPEELFCTDAKVEVPESKVMASGSKGSADAVVDLGRTAEF